MRGYTVIRAASVTLPVRMSVRALKEKRLELSTPNMVDIQCVAVDLKVNTLRFEVYAVIKCAAGAGLHVDMTA